MIDSKLLFSIFITRRSPSEVPPGKDIWLDCFLFHQTQADVEIEHYRQQDPQIQNIKTHRILKPRLI
jgi:hypothetical protein